MPGFWVTVVTAVVVAFLTTLASEPLKMLLYRNKHIIERRFQNQVDALPKYIAALNWAASACTNANSGWQQTGVGPFYYTGEAAERLVTAINVGIEVAYLFPKELETDILAFGVVMRTAYNNYMIATNAVTPLPTQPTPAIQQVFTTMASDVGNRENEMKQRYRKLVELD